MDEKAAETCRAILQLPINMLLACIKLVFFMYIMFSSLSAPLRGHFILAALVPIELRVTNSNILLQLGACCVVEQQTVVA